MILHILYRTAKYMSIETKKIFRKSENQDRETVFFLFFCKLIENNEIIGSVACYGNEIDDLIVNKEYQNKGYGKKLLLWAMNLIRKNNNDPITLHVAKWNKNALKLYTNIGFVITNTETIS